MFPAKIAFAACNITKEGMEKREGHAIAILPGATIVPSGVVRLMYLQEQGWSYVRP
jgi:intracellular sulfur oxidation DsrE/DsrF family protein